MGGAGKLRFRESGVSHVALWFMIFLGLGIGITALVLSSWATPRVRTFSGLSVPNFGSCQSGVPPQSACSPGAQWICQETMILFECSTNSTWVQISNLPSLAGTLVVRFVATGNGTAYYSFDGIVWTQIGDPVITVGLAVGFAPELQQWLIGGVNGLSRSTDGVHYTLVTLPIPVNNVTAICWSSQQRRWVIGTDVGMFYSANGISWTQTLNGQPQVTDIIYAPRQLMWLAAGYNITYSTDGNNWTNINDRVFSTRANSICTSWDSLLTLAFGSGTDNSVAMSQIGYNAFVGLGKPIFPTAPGDMSCSYGAGNMFVIGGRSVGSNVTIGYTTIPYAQVAVTNGNLIATRVSVSTSGTLVSLSAFVVAPSPTGSLTLAVYSDTGLGYPGSLIATTGSQSIVGLGSRLVTFSPTVANVPITAPTVWIVHYFTAFGDTIAANSSVVGVSSLGVAFSGSTMPLSWPTNVAATTLAGTYHQFATITTTSNLAYTTDGVTFNNIGSSTSGTVNAVAYSPSLGIWVIGGEFGFGNSYSGTHWEATATGVTINAIGVHYTPQISPTSIDGVVALSGVDPLPSNAPLFKFLFGGYGNGGLGGNFRSMGYTTDNRNVYAIQAPTSFSSTTGVVRSLLYTPETTTWMAWFEYSALASTNNIYGTSDSNPFGGNVWARGPKPVLANVTSMSWSSVQQVYFYTSLFNNTSVCWYTAFPYIWISSFENILISPCEAVLDIAAMDAAYSVSQNLWVIVGRGSTHNMAYASNLAGPWTGFGPTGNNNTIVSVNFIPFAGIWIFGDSTITSDPRTVAVSSTLQTPLTTINGCAYDAQRLRIVCAGIGPSDTLAYSADGSSWTGLGNTIFTSQGNDVAYNDGVWMAVGNGNNAQVASSLDGTTWNVISTNVFNGTLGGALVVEPTFIQ